MEIKKSSVRSFGFLFFIVFILIALWPMLAGENIRYWAILISFIFFILGLLKSKILIPLNNVWIKIGEYLGKIIAPIVMFVIYFSIVTPIGLVLRLFGKDLLKLKFNKLEKSYWIKRENIKSMKRQF